MKAYVIGHYTIDDEEKYLQYVMKVGATVTQFGGRTLVADHEITIVEGEPKPFVVVVEFESKDKAKEWYNSPEYQQIINFRKESTTGWVLLANEFVLPQQ